MKVEKSPTKQSRADSTPYSTPKKPRLSSGKNLSGLKASPFKRPYAIPSNSPHHEGYPNDFWINIIQTHLNNESPSSPARFGYARAIK